jgi:hypothetical protein
LLNNLLSLLSITTKARQWIVGLGLLFAVCAALFGAGWYKGSQSATNAATALKNAEIAKAVQEYQAREVENRKHIEKARAVQNAQKTNIASRVTSDADGLRDLIARSADKTGEQSCARNESASITDRSADQGGPAPV